VTEEADEKAFGSMQRCWSDEEHSERDLGQCRGAGVTEEHSEKAFGSMQRCWSDRRAFRKSIWVNAEELE
jgi:hypothetical protein